MPQPVGKLWRWIIFIRATRPNIEWKHAHGFLIQETFRKRWRKLHSRQREGGGGAAASAAAPWRRHCREESEDSAIPLDFLFFSRLSVLFHLSNWCRKTTGNMTSLPVTPARLSLALRFQLKGWIMMKRKRCVQNCILLYWILNILSAWVR